MTFPAEMRIGSLEILAGMKAQPLMPDPQLALLVDPWVVDLGLYAGDGKTQPCQAT